MSDTPSWYGWVKLFGRWHRLSGPHPTMSSASRVLDAEVRHRRISVHPRWLRLTAGGPPRD